MNFIFTSFLIILFQSSLIFAQSIPKSHFSYQSRKLLYDAGKDWESLTVFGPIRFKTKKKNKSIATNLYNNFDWQIGFDAGNESFSIFGHGNLKYNNHLYGYFYPSFNRNRIRKQHFGVKTDFKNNQNHQSGIGFQNNWATMQIGRGKESWGSGNDIQLALSENSGNYDYILLASDYGKIRVKYIYGFLEKVEPNIYRYITARGFEWTNKRSLIIGFSETVVYSGENRSIDIGYLNPMSSHLEIELNNRLNVLGNVNSNAVWQMHLDYLMSKNIRVSFNYLYDEFVIDPDIQIGKEHGKAHSIKFAYTPIFSEKHILTLYGKSIYVGTPTFRHRIGMNNFVQNGRPLGWSKGSDGQEFSIGINYFNNKSLIVSLSNGILMLGEETITNRMFDSYVDYLKGKFPSGKVEEKYIFKAEIIYFLNGNQSISSIFQKSPNGNLINFKINVPIFNSQE